MQEFQVKLALVVVAAVIVGVWLATNTYTWRERLGFYLTKPRLFLTILLEAAVFFPQIVYPTILPFPKTLWDKEISLFGLTVYTAGAIIAVWAKLTMGKSWGLPAQHDIKRQKQLVTTGPFVFSRNPIYLGLLLMLLGFELALRSLLVLLVIPVSILIYRAILVEEKLLEQLFGKKYLHYKQKTPRFLTK